MSNALISNLPQRYILSGNSASGGFSDVYFCNDQHLHRKVAIKTIKNKSELNRLQDEISALLQLRSKHVVQVFDIINIDDSSFGIVMEYIKGKDLFNSDIFPKSETQLLKILWQIASGISVIHNAGLIHRDIKPNNMKLDDEGILKIFDFGLSRNKGTNAATVGFRGTIEYSAPELFSHDRIVFTSAIDVYAFGAIALFLATQKMPHELKKNHFQALPHNSFNCGFLNNKPSLISLFEQSLAMLPEDRPTIHQLRDELDRYLLADKHQALVVMNGKVHVLNSTSRNVKLKLSDIGSFEIHYNGFYFLLQNVSGEVYINNIKAESDMKILGACVVGIGNTQRHHNERCFITFDISNPEVTL